MQFLDLPSADDQILKERYWSNRLNNMLTILRRIYEMPARSNRFRSMEGLRAYAALLVFLVHYFDAYGRELLKVDLNNVRLSQITDLQVGIVYWLFASHYGVDIFFFLSGFLICRMLAKSEFNFFYFIKNRVLRIYPAALGSLCMWAYIRIGIQGWYDFDLSQLFGNLAFLNAVPALAIKPYNTVTWSLFYELVFYLTFPLIMLFPSSDRRLSGGNLVVFGLIYMCLISQLGGMFIRFLMFFVGALMATFSTGQLKTIAQRTPVGLVIVSYVGSTLVFAEYLRYEYFIPLFAFTTFFFVVKVLFSKSVLYRFFTFTPFRYLGNISYSFYLMHNIGIELIMYRYRYIFEGLDRSMFLFVTIILSLLISIMLSTLLFQIAERPYFTHRQSMSCVMLGGQRRVTNQWAGFS
jgi:peptidoglycan/LPS O-acetylase OafA/YrhL